MVPFSADYYILGRFVGDLKQILRAEAKFTPICRVIPTSPWLRRLDRPDPQPKSIQAINPLDSILCRVASRATKRLVNNLFR